MNRKNILNETDRGNCHRSYSWDSSTGSHSRRAFLGRVGGLTAGAMAVQVAGVAPLLDTKEADAAEVGPESPQQRRNHAYEVRHEAALSHKNLSLPDQPTNGDEVIYPNRIGSYSKDLTTNIL